jgi:hypothetical protein
MSINSRYPVSGNRQRWQPPAACRLPPELNNN